MNDIVTKKYSSDYIESASLVDRIKSCEEKIQLTLNKFECEFILVSVEAYGETVSQEIKIVDKYKK